ncbi:bZIP transcription factor [Paraphaeosphaeria sporulosa]
MEVEANMHHCFGEPSWANDAYLALDNGAVFSSDKWAAALSKAPSSSQSAFTNPTSLLTPAAVGRYGQVTAPKDLSPMEPPCEPLSEGSIPLEELQNEALFADHQTQALQEYKPQVQDEPAAKRRRISRQSSAKDLGPRETKQAQQNSQPPKRKRGRPKSTPQMIEHYTADVFPFQVSSAQQSHLEKNRIAAHRCRQRKKEYISGLEARARESSPKNRVLRANVALLREEVLSLKNEVLRHASCGFWAVDEYLSRCAGDLLGVDAPTSLRDPQSTRPRPGPMSSSSLYLDDVHRRSSSSGSVLSAASSPNNNDYSDLDLLHDINKDEVSI